MLSIKFDESRPREKGQWYVELIDINQNDPAYSHRFGYWCDLPHLLTGIASPLLAELGKLVDDYTILTYVHRGHSKPLTK